MNFFTIEDSFSSNTTNLRRLYWLRNISIILQSGVVFVAIQFLDMNLPLANIVFIIALLAGFNLFVGFRLKSQNEFTHNEFFTHLLIDTLCLALLLYHAGGAANPFVSIFLIPLTISATVLPAFYTWFLTLIAIILYSLLLKFYIPLPHSHFLHIFGMWFGFVLSASLICYFIVNMGMAVRKKELLLSQANEQAIKQEKLIAIGTLAASTAHEMGTPLATISLLVNELEAIDDSKEETDNVIQSLKQQVKRCKDTLATLSASAGGIHLTGGSLMCVDDYLSSVLKQWQKKRPNIEVITNWHDSDSNVNILSDQTLTQAIHNILDNAADVSTHPIVWEANWDSKILTINVKDNGPGLSKQAQEQIGKKPYTNKDQGLGLGLFLSYGIIERFGGSVSLKENPGGGLCTKLSIPLNNESDS